MNVDHRINELLDAETGIPGIPAFWKAVCQQKAVERTPEQRERYLRENLEILDRYYRPLTASRNADGTPTPLAQLAARLDSCVDYAEVAQTLNITPPREADEFQWLFWAYGLQLQPAFCIACAAAQLTSPLLSDEYSEELRGLPMFLLAYGLRLVGSRGNAQAARLLESYLELDETDYRDGASMRAALDRSAKLAELKAQLRANVVRVLADGLRFVGSRGNAQAVRLLESYLELDETDYQDGASMRAALDRSAKLDELTAGNRAIFLKKIAASLRFVSGRGRAQAVRLLEALVEVPIYEFATSAVWRQIAWMNVLGVMQTWCRAVDGTHKFALETCRAIVSYIRNLREDVLPTYEHRMDFWTKPGRFGASCSVWRQNMRPMSAASVRQEPNGPKTRYAS